MEFFLSSSSCYVKLDRIEGDSGILGCPSSSQCVAGLDTGKQVCLLTKFSLFYTFADIQLEFSTHTWPWPNSPTVTKQPLHKSYFNSKIEIVDIGLTY